MRIAVIAPPWVPIPPKFYGGTENVIDTLVRGYEAAGHEVLLFATGDSTCPVPTKHIYAEAQGLRINTVEPELRHVVHAYDAVRDFDIVHDHTVMGPMYAERFADIRVVTTVHGPFDDERADIYRAMADRVHVVAISESQRREAPDLRISKVIHHGIEAADFPYSPTAGDYCVFLGRMALDKGVSHAIAACVKADVPLKIAGKMRTNAEKSYFEERVRPHLSDTIEYLGEVPHDEKLQLLSGARAMVFPIRWNEPFGLVMLESMACGTPVIASPYGAVPEVVVDGRTGFLCRDDASMAESIARVDQIDRQECRAAVEGYFSAPRMVADYLALFDVLVR